MPTGPRAHYWTPEEDQYLREHFKDDFEETAKHLNRLPNAVRARGYKIGLRRTHPRKPYNLPELTKEDIIYIAGLFDGEGCIGLYSKLPRLQIRNTHKPTIMWLQQVLGCNVNSTDYRSFNRAWRNSFQWYTTRHEQCLKILEAIFDYLKIKKSQAEVMLRYLRGETNYELAEKELKLLKKIEYEV